MYYESLPLYPGMRPPCGAENCVRMKLFDGCEGRGCPPPPQPCGRVTIENPCCPGECVEVELGVDACGSLTVCVHRDPCRPCPKPGKPRCGPPRRPDRRDPCDRHDRCDRPDWYDRCGRPRCRDC